MTNQLNLFDIKNDWCNRMTPIVLASFKSEFTTDDIHRVVEAPAHPNWFGVLVAQLKNKGLVEKVGYRTSQRKEANGRAVAAWRVK